MLPVFRFPPPASCYALESVVLVSVERTKEEGGGVWTNGKSRVGAYPGDAVLGATCESRQAGKAERAVRACRLRASGKTCSESLREKKKEKLWRPDNALTKSPSACTWGLPVYTVFCLGFSGAALLRTSSSQRLEWATSSDRRRAELLKPCSRRGVRGRWTPGKGRHCLLPVLLPPWLLVKGHPLCPSPDTYTFRTPNCTHSLPLITPVPQEEPPGHHEKAPLPSKPCWWMFPMHNYLNLGVYFATIFWMILALTLLYYKHLCNHASRLIWRMWQRDGEILPTGNKNPVFEDKYVLQNS